MEENPKTYETGDEVADTIRLLESSYGIESGLVAYVRRLTSSSAELPDAVRITLASNRVVSMDLFDPLSDEMAEARLSSLSTSPLEVPSIAVFLKNITALDKSAGEVMPEGNILPLITYAYTDNESGNERAIFLYYNADSPTKSVRSSLAPIIHDVPIDSLLVDDVTDSQPIALQGFPLVDSDTKFSDIPQVESVELPFGDTSGKSLVFSSVHPGRDGTDVPYVLSLYKRGADFDQTAMPTAELMEGEHIAQIFARSWQVQDLSGMCRNSPIYY